MDCRCLAKSLVSDPTLRRHECPKVVMLERRKISTDADTDRCNQVASRFLILAEKELSGLHPRGRQVVRRKAGSPIGIGLDRGTGTYGLAIRRVDSRLASGYIGRKCSARQLDVQKWQAKSYQPRTKILVSASSGNGCCRSEVRLSSAACELL